MTTEEILREINSLPPEAQRQLEEFISFLRERYQETQAKSAPSSNLEAEAFVGMWRDREDMQDSLAWVRQVRQSHWVLYLAAQRMFKVLAHEVKGRTGAKLGLYHLIKKVPAIGYSLRTQTFHAGFFRHASSADVDEAGDRNNSFQLQGFKSVSQTSLCGLGGESSSPITFGQQIPELNFGTLSLRSHT